MKEKIVIIFIALAFGLFLTTAGFYFYQATKKIPENKKTGSSITQNSPEVKSAESKTLLTINDPKNESLTNTRTIEIKGETNPGNVIIVSSNLEDVVTHDTSSGSFTVKIEIESGTNIITTRSISKEGEEVVDKRMITYSQEEF